MLTHGQPAPRRAYAVLPLGWAGLVLLLTLTPAQDMPITPVWELLSFDTAAHAGVFAVLAGLSWFSLSRQRRWPRVARHAGLLALAGSTLFGGLIELLQHSMRLGRHGDWTDLLSDGIGAALGVAVVTWWGRRQARRAGLLLPSAIGVGVLLSSLPAQAQDLPRARRTIEKLAAEGMHGRGYVRQGDRKAAAYLRGRLRGLKLEPLAPDYTQPFALDINTFPGELSLKVKHLGLVASGLKTTRLVSLAPGLDFIVAPDAKTAKLRDVRVIRLDTFNLISAVAQQAWLTEFRQHASSKRAVLIAPLAQQKYAQQMSYLRPAIDSSAVQLELVSRLNAALSSNQATYTKLAVLNNDKYWGNAGGLVQLELKVEAQLQRNYQTQNLAAVIRGTAQPDSFLVVTAHYDHLGRMGRRTYFPGANDNASGVALLLELAAHYARPENRPACSVVFLLFGAEEAGLLGSKYFVAHPVVPLQRIKFLFNLDLLGTGEQGATVVNGRVLEGPYQRLVKLNEARQYLPALAARGRAANSDHFPFSEAGVPAFFLYTRGGSAAYHDVNDRPAALSLAGFAGAFGLVRDFLNELGAGSAQKNSR